MNSHVNTIPRCGSVLILIHIFGLSYFLLLMAAFLIRHLPRSSDDIYNAQAVIFYIIGVMQWCLCSLLYRAVWILDQEQAASWTKIERASTLFLIYVVATPFLLSTCEPYGQFRSAYLFFLTIMTVGRITTVVSLPSYNGDHFVQDCLFLGSLAITPSIYVLCQPGQPAPPLAAGLIRLVGCNLLGFLCYLVQLPERLNLVGHWEPSLYAMHLAIILGCISYAPAVLGIAA